VPDRKYPWFCQNCGYAASERLRHFHVDEPRP
jgi:ribosomal protein L37E